MLRNVCAVLFIGIGLAIFLPVFSDAKDLVTSRPRSMKFERNGKIGVDTLKQIESDLKKSPGFDLKNNKVMELFTWDGPSGVGVIAAVREGIGVSAGCAIYEKIGGSGFEYVNGEPFCWFSSPSGQISDGGRFGVKFVGKIRQSSDSPINSMEFDLFYDGRRGIFCDPLSTSDKFNCNGKSTNHDEKEDSSKGK
ncbi:hypothetical protein ACFSHT_40185 [Paraburkholderia silviterrae]|uniref:Uncharacterized protein n=1 Tax=Paraburkholderia silviterrae TaxID=2528715 RepID=A0A4R5LX45_9BURK|nr:hypothetical protein [Paraburkholderia silviterrae]TDG16371.1 hypothetical protein EYW47_40580 [Paraburkholderia silviterrae]